MIRYWCNLNPGVGYSNAARGYIQALAEVGLGPGKVMIAPAIGSSLHAADVDPDDWLLKDYMSQGAIKETPINLVHVHPPWIPKHWTAGMKNVAICSWETDALPKGKFPDADGHEATLVEHFERFVEIWVATDLVRKTFVNSGVKTPIYVIPYALQNELLARPVKEKKISVPDVHPALMPPGKSYGETVKFYTVGSWDERKNQAGLLRAWFSTGWTPKDPVELMMHCTPPSRDRAEVEAHGMIASAQAMALKESTADPFSVPLFGLHTTPKKYSDILDLHEHCHVFVTATRGEGFCLPVLEALAMGNYAIGPDPVLAHFLDVDHFLSVSSIEVPISMMNVDGYEPTQNWWQPSQKKLISAMDLMVGEVREEMPSSEMVNAVRRVHSPRRIGEVIKNRLEVLMET